MQVWWTTPLNSKGKAQGVGAAVPPSVVTVMHWLSSLAVAIVTVDSSIANVAATKGKAILFAASKVILARASLWHLYVPERVS